MLTVGAVEILVADSHGDGGNNRIARFTSDGTYIGEWGETGTARGQFLDPHDLAVDSGGWLFVADRGNYRIRIFDQEGNLLDVWTQCGKPDGLFIDANDVLYVTGANSRPGANTGWEQGIRIGDGRTGWIEAFILSPLPADGAGGWEGVTADNHRNICPAVDGGPSLPACPEVRQPRPGQVPGTGRTVRAAALRAHPGRAGNSPLDFVNGCRRGGFVARRATSASSPGEGSGGQ